MVKAKSQFSYRPDGGLDVEAWLDNKRDIYQLADINLLRRSALFLQNKSKPQEQGFEIAEVLLSLTLDQETTSAGMLSATPNLIKDEIKKELGDTVAKLVEGLLKTDVIPALQKQQAGNQAQMDKIRKMLLAMATDIRVVIIRLAERLVFMRSIKTMEFDERKKHAQEVSDIYAPLANRLGIGQIKWELEDLAFRYQQPETYKKIAGFLAERREERESRIQRLIQELQEKLKANHIQASVTGRAKHIYSIYLKMQRKQLSQSEIFDHSAIRILVATVEECYTALSVVNSLWPPLLNEFDDYIANPKPNGYRSIHTAVIGPDEKHFEIQIRTHAMHEESERGVAAHWMYKEGEPSALQDQNKISLLRQLIDWHQEVAGATTTAENSQVPILEDLVYVITPAGDIIDLPAGSTPIDFAYAVHSDVGHRCRGAKVNGHIVPLTYHLQTGDKVEIHAIAEGAPSRDWLRESLGFVKSHRAKTKIKQWFHSHEAPEEAKPEIQAPRPKKVTAKVKAVSTRPVTTNASGLLTRYAKCCQPKPGDPIVGYITQTKGISIHLKTCKNMANLTNPERFITIAWK